MLKFNLSRTNIKKKAQMDFLEPVRSYLDREQASAEIKKFDKKFTETPTLPIEVMSSEMRQIISDLNAEFMSRQSGIEDPTERYNLSVDIMNRVLSGLRMLKIKHGLVIDPSIQQNLPSDKSQQVPVYSNAIFNKYIQDNSYYDDFGNLMINLSEFSLPPENFNIDEFIGYLNDQPYSEAFVSSFIQSMERVLRDKGVARNLTDEEINDACQSVMVSVPNNEKYKRILADYVKNKNAVVHGKRIPRTGFYPEEVISDTSKQTTDMQRLLSTDPQFVDWYEKNVNFVDQGTTRALSQIYLPAKDTSKVPRYILVDKLDGRIGFILSDPRILQEYNNVFPCSDLMETHSMYHKKKEKSILYDTVKQQIMECNDNGLEKFIDFLIQNKDPRIIKWVQKNVGALARGEMFDMLKMKELEVDSDEGKKYELQGKALNSSTGTSLTEEEERHYRVMGTDFIKNEFSKVKQIIDLIVPVVYRMGVRGNNPGKIANANAMKFISDLYQKRLRLLMDQGRFIVKDNREQYGGSITMNFFYPPQGILGDIEEAKKLGFMKIIFDPKSPDRGVVDLEFRKLVTGWGKMDMSLDGSSNAQEETKTFDQFQGSLRQQLKDIDRIVQKYEMYRQSLEGRGRVDDVVNSVIREINPGLDPKNQYTLEDMKYLLSTGKSDILLHQNIPTEEEYLLYQKENFELKKHCIFLDNEYPEESDEVFYSALINYKIKNGMKSGGLSLGKINKIRSGSRRIRKKLDVRSSTLSDLAPILLEMMNTSYVLNDDSKQKKLISLLKKWGADEVLEDISRGIYQTASINDAQDLLEQWGQKAMNRSIFGDPEYKELTHEELLDEYYDKYGDPNKIIDAKTGKTTRDKKEKLLRDRMKGDNLRWDIFNWVEIALEGIKDGVISYQALKPFFNIFVPHMKMLFPKIGGSREVMESQRKNVPIILRMMRKPLSFWAENYQKRISTLLEDWGKESKDVLEQMKSGIFKPITSDEASVLLTSIKTTSEKMIEAAYHRVQTKIEKLYLMKKSMMKLSSKTIQIEELIEDVKIDYTDELNKYLDWGNKYDQNISDLPVWKYRI